MNGWRRRIATLLLSAAVLGVLASPAAAKEPPFRVAISNGFVGSEWRTQMVESARVVFEEYKARGLVTGDLYVNHAGPDVTAQIAQLRNMINRGFDLIIINPNSQTALNPVIEEAVERGIVVVVVDQEVTSPKAINVVIDQAEWARISARWLAETLNGQGKIVAINGLAGHPANEDRWRGAQEVFAQYPQLELLTMVHGDWDQATGQQRMSDLLATYPEIDGVWAQDGTAEGALRAVLNSGRELPVMTGEARVGYMRLWNDLRAQGFQSIGVINPPGIAASGLRIGMQVLLGREFREGVLVRGNTLYVPIPGTITNENFDELWARYQDFSDAYSLDGWLAEEEALAYFQ